MTDYSTWVLKDKHEKLLFGPYQGDYDEWYYPGLYMGLNPMTGSNRLFNTNLVTWCALMCFSIELQEQG